MKDLEVRCVQVRQMFQSLSDQDRHLQIQMGLDTLGNGNGYVSRSISSFNPKDQTVQVSLPRTLLYLSMLGCCVSSACLLPHAWPITMLQANQCSCHPSMQPFFIHTQAVRDLPSYIILHSETFGCLLSLHAWHIDSQAVQSQQSGSAAHTVITVKARCQLCMSCQAGCCSLQVAVDEVPEGSRVQLHVRDPQWAQGNILRQLQVLPLLNSSYAN